MIEVERKYLGVNLDELKKRLESLAWEHKSSCFEFNYILDTENDDLYKSDRLLRLRENICQTGWRECILTYKQPAAQTDKFVEIDQKMQEALDTRGTKIREELEFPVPDRADMLRMLAGLGYTIRKRYEKARETWTSLPLAVADWPIPEKVTVCLDCLPFGEFVEIEGPETAIDEAEKLLGLDKMKKSSTNYHKLYLAWLEEHSLPKDKPCVFDPEGKRAACGRIGLVSSDLWDDGVWQD